MIRHRQRPRLLMAVTAAILTRASFAQAPATEFDPLKLPDVVAIVEGVEISRDRLHKEALAAREDLAAEGDSRVMDEAFYREALDQIIAGLVLENEAERLGLAATPEELASEMSVARRSQPDEAAFLAALERAGISEEEFAADIRQQISIAKLVTRRIRPSMEISEQEIEQVYKANREQLVLPERVLLRHIFLPVGTDTDNAATDLRAHAESLVARIRDGEDFAAVARAESRDPSAANGGALPWLARGQTLPAFEEAAFSLAPGELSGVVTSTAGHHILQVLEHRPAGIAELDEARAGLIESYRDAALEPTLRRFVADLERQRGVERFALGRPDSP